MFLGSFAIQSGNVFAHTPPRRDWAPLAMLRIEDAQHEPIAQAAAGGTYVLVHRMMLHDRQPAFVCAAPGRCGVVTAVIDCTQSNQQTPGCPQGMLWIQHTPIPPLVQQQPPPMVVPSEYDPCHDRRNEPWEHGLAVSIGPSFAIHDGRPQFGFTFAPGYRRFVPNSEPNHWRTPQCSDPTPFYRNEFGGVFFGTELGFDLRGHIHWSLPASTSEVSGSVGFAPIMRLVVARGRLRIPSILGLFMPEIGVRSRSIKYDETGARVMGSPSQSSLYLRPAGLSIAYLFAAHPVLGIDLSAAPWVEIPLSGQPVNVGFSVSLQFLGIGWD